jgi:N-acetylglucosaminyl-diphospho-decaprenol L-rhamnosyltransferase
MSAQPQPVALDVAIVSYRCRDLLRACLASLDEHAPVCPMSTCVVDNASGDGTAAMVAREFPHVTLIESETNRGFAAATNVAIGHGSAPYVLVLNPDTEVRAETLDRLVELMEDQPDIGVSGCRLELEDGTFDHASRRSFPTLVGALGHFTGIGRVCRSGPLAQYRAPDVERGPVDAVNGAFMLIRRGALEQVGLFDEGYWMYMEDLDLCYRLKQGGWVTWYEPSVSALHVKRGTTAGLRSPQLVWAFHYGMLRFYRRHYAPPRRRAINWLVYAGIGGRAAVVLFLSVITRSALLNRQKHQAGLPAQPDLAASDRLTG